MKSGVCIRNEKAPTRNLDVGENNFKWESSAHLIQVQA